MWISAFGLASFFRRTVGIANLLLKLMFVTSFLLVAARYKRLQT